MCSSIGSAVSQLDASFSAASLGIFLRSSALPLARALLPRHCLLSGDGWLGLLLLVIAVRRYAPFLLPNWLWQWSWQEAWGSVLTSNIFLRIGQVDSSTPGRQWKNLSHAVANVQFPWDEREKVIVNGWLFSEVQKMPHRLGLSSRWTFIYGIAHDNTQNTLHEGGFWR